MNDYRESGNPPRAITDGGETYRVSLRIPSDIAPPPAYTGGNVTVRVAPIGHADDTHHDPDDEDMTYDLRTLPQREDAIITKLRSDMAAQERHYNEALNTAVFGQGALESSLRGDMTALALRCDSLSEQLEAALSRITRLEEREHAHAAAIERTADAVQVLILRGGGG